MMYSSRLTDNQRHILKPIGTERAHRIREAPPEPQVADSRAAKQSDIVVGDSSLCGGGTGKSREARGGQQEKRLRHRGIVCAVRQKISPCAIDQGEGIGMVMRERAASSRGAGGERENWHGAVVSTARVYSEHWQA